MKTLGSGGNGNGSRAVAEVAPAIPEGSPAADEEAAAAAE